MHVACGCVCVCACACVCVCVCVCVREQAYDHSACNYVTAHVLPHLTCLFVVLLYGVATISRLLQITGFFCRISSLLYGSFAKETYHFKEPTTRSYPTAGICVWVHGGDCIYTHMYKHIGVNHAPVYKHMCVHKRTCVQTHVCT